MIWLDAIDNLGNALYFDIHHVERRRRGRRWQHAVNGICGNGVDEIDVLVEPDSDGCVTFADLSSEHSGASLLAAVDRSNLEYALLQVATEHCSHRASLRQQHWGDPVRYEAQPGRIAEPGPVWRQVV